MTKVSIIAIWTFWLVRRLGRSKSRRDESLATPKYDFPTSAIVHKLCDKAFELILLEIAWLKRMWCHIIFAVVKNGRLPKISWKWIWVSFFDSCHRDNCGKFSKWVKPRPCSTKDTWCTEPKHCIWYCVLLLSWLKILHFDLSGWSFENYVFVINVWHLISCCFVDTVFCFGRILGSLVSEWKCTLFWMWW